jgi:hypothetical protein
LKMNEGSGMPTGNEWAEDGPWEELDGNWR